VIPFLSLFRELAPRLAGLGRTVRLPMGGSGGFLNPADDTRIHEIAPAALAKFKELPLIVDVREKEEFFSGHIKGAKNISRGSLERTVAEIAPDRASPILLYCAAGNRAALAADSLQKMGYRNVFSLKGGLSGWLEAGGWVETPTAVQSGRSQVGRSQVGRLR
jgi:phage shock protein E